MSAPDRASRRRSPQLWAEIAFLGGVLAVSVTALVTVGQIPAGDTFMTGPRGFPTVIAGLLVLACGIRIVTALVRPESSPGTDADQAPGEAPAAESKPTGRAAWQRRITGPWGVLVISMGYALLLQPLGFILASWLYGVLLAVPLHPKGLRSLPSVVLIVGGLVLLAWVTFVLWLRAPLPTGVLG